MKSAALIFGVIAGLLGVGAFVLGNIDSGLAGSAVLGPHHETIARLIVYLVPAICWLGAGLALGHPRLGGLVLLLSAAGWGAIALVVGHGAVFFAAAPFIFAAAGGLVALFARRPARRLPATSTGTDGDDAVVEAATMAQPASRRSDPTPPRTVQSRVDARLPPRRAEAAIDDQSGRRIAPPFQDIVPEPEPSPDPPIVEAATPRLADDAEPSIVPAEPQESLAEAPIIALAPAANEVIVGSAPHSRRPSEWTLPTPAAASPRYAADRQTAEPSRIEPLAPAALPAPDQRPRGVSALDFGATNDFATRRDGTSARDDAESAGEIADKRRFGRRQVTEDTPAFKPDAPGEKSRGGGVRRVVRLLIALLFIIVLLGIAAAVYLDYRRGAQSILFGRHPHLAGTAGTTTTTPPPPTQPAPAPRPEPSVPTTPAPVSHPAPQPAAIHSPVPSMPASPPAAIVASTTTPRVSTATPPAQPTVATSAPPIPATAPADAVPPAAATSPSAAAPSPPVTTADSAASPAGFSDANAYCAAVGTIDAPDARYTGPAVPRVVTTALLAPQSTPDDQIHWRCANGAAFACSAHHTNACMPTPTVENMLKYCAQHVDAKNLPAPNGSWSCNGTRPVIPEDQSWPVDPQGFFPGAWIRVSPVG